MAAKRNIKILSTDLVLATRLLAFLRTLFAAYSGQALKFSLYNGFFFFCSAPLLRFGRDKNVARV